MRDKHVYLSCLISGLTLGTAWAVRGKFGHEQGAAWAGGIGALVILLLAKRADWYANVFKITWVAAFGWGVGGIISYGRVVGFGRADDFINVYYGLLMLFLIGGLYGFLGGGLFGLALADSEKNKVTWHSLVVEMTVGALITYGLLINQLEWLMTPPRSELWAACLGMAIALGWYLLRNQQSAAWRVALYSGLGAGFGFAFGNFLQVLGTVSGIAFNFWNVMEYAIGFFGGIGMAYGTFTASWPVSEIPSKQNRVLIPFLLVFVFIPFVVWEQSFTQQKLQEIFLKYSTVDFVWLIQCVALASIIGMAGYLLYVIYLKTSGFISYSSVRTVFIWYFGVYIFLSFLITGTPFHTQLPEQYLYLVNLGIVLFGLSKLQPGLVVQAPPSHAQRWVVSSLCIMAILAVLAFIAIHSHGELPGSQKRFGEKSVVMD
ncbi:hypothetical protein GXP67_13365 [Rhodocytophaga rosea]|uniref:DUF3464 family protein n=1 Tax=Rhodocytophaga rosea TaxID=2704465 RepID=A0A6C0GI90_9BACT|nr:hypothetical protein [Rhodocytophaga rosea]QHT67544.1 hypothetical protein GXP67_13365 [Rhodocytophaga rosea]